MKKYIYILLTILVVFIVYTFLGRISPEIPVALNLFTIMVVYLAVLDGEVMGAVFGAVCGLIQDSFSLGVFGVAGIATTLMGYLAGFISRKIYVISFFKIFLFIFTMSSFQLIVWKLIHSFVFSEPVFSESHVILSQPFFNALVGSALFPFFRKIFQSVSSDSL
ncbi:MAG: rod shape-determining protein MreD [Candidatus Aminicenantes bacterium]|nr:rod shape-determining protein MreD [Candidatus Aminicenantes bacterium]